ncbi:uncharacterized protein BJ212DRAFT_1304121 [Suillus subaureus]|uniref:Uncharacterized protein n=1 Tax=Suillus subaureus TaxID=48587 RepID=A0A9P7DXG9_9AGAM|nr:uncharacterized protein BJ212DRAFT_1304121 [Suillus subaureus]KAG1805343.1 hypothetical protein BJ212DRAFT_1304121 [Suillus subaureus]
MLSPPQLAPESLGLMMVTVMMKSLQAPASREKRRVEGEQKEDLENNEYTEDVQPTSVWCCRGWPMYYPGLWVKHQGKCPGILKMENQLPAHLIPVMKIERGKEDRVMRFSMLNVCLCKACWEREARQLAY